MSVRVIAATNRVSTSWSPTAGSGEDLFYRLSVVPIRVPALRERREDVARARRVFPRRVLRAQQLPAQDDGRRGGAVLERYDWPGNVRELRNVVERMAILTPGRSNHRRCRCRWRFACRTSAAPSGLHGMRDAAERERISQALEQTNWNVSGAARLLGVERTNLHKRIRALGLSRE